MPTAAPDLPRGVGERQRWLPPALRTVQSLLLEQVGRWERMTERPAAALAWHANLSRRVWRPPAVPADGLPPAPAPAVHPQPPAPPGPNPPPSGAPPTVPQPAPGDAGPRAATAPRGAGVTPSRPAVPLSELPGPPGKVPPPRDQGVGGHRDGRFGAASRPPGWPQASWTAPPPSAPAPPRRQARATEPWRPAPPAAAGNGADDLGAGERGHRGQPPPAPRFPPPTERALAPAAPSPPGAGGLLGRLLDEVVEPVALPGLAFRPAPAGAPPGPGPARPAEPPPAGQAREEAAPWPG
ncbi:MAG TPA: hypothetical protein VF486_07940, partial [Actinomycetes bacterium]